MATRLKTVEYWFPMIDTLADNVATSASPILITLPEQPTSFRSCILEAVIADANTTLSNITVRNLRFRLGSEIFEQVNNVQTLTNGGENFTFHCSADFTSHFNSFWGGSISKTADCQIAVNTGALGCRNASIKLTITYEFNDNASTHAKTVWIPLNAPSGALTTTKGAVYDTVPALDTYLPEASKTYYQITAVVQGNTESGNATDMSISMALDSVNDFTSQLYEKGTTVDNWYRVNADYTGMDTSTQKSFYLWASTTDFDHPQAWLVVTYGFNAPTTTSIMNSLWLPMEIDSPMGGPTAADYQRAEREVWVQEPNPVLNRLAFYCFYDKSAAISGLNARIGSGSFVSFTDVAAVIGGGAGFMIRNDTAFGSIQNGRNTYSFDIYNTDNVDLGYNVSGFWILNYTSDVPSQGIWSANHTVINCYKPVGTGAASAQTIVTGTSFVIPEPDRFLTSIGLNYVYTSNGTGNPSGVHIGVERLPLEGGIIWESIYSDIGGSDPETGIRQCWSTARSVFTRWRETSLHNIVDPGPGRLDITDARRVRLALALGCASFDHLDLYITYHSITYTVSGNITGVDPAGGPVILSLHRALTGEKVFETEYTPSGTTLSYSFIWFDNTEEVYVSAYQDANHVGRSASGLAV